MKTFLLAATSVVALLAAGSALAAGNASTIDQAGISQNAAVDQSNSTGDSVASITQVDAYNSAGVTQGGSANQATINQSQGTDAANRIPSNVSASDQIGVNGVISVIQVGNNSSSISQLGAANGEIALVGQSGDENSSAISQNGTNEFAVVNQEEGGNNVASISQAGVGNGSNGPQAGAVRAGANLWRNENVPSDSVLAGASGGNTDYGPVGAYVDQQGNSNTGVVSQQGLDNFADVSQGNQDGSANNTGVITQGAGIFFTDAVIYQDGHSNVAAINQFGSGSGYSTIWQNGTSNQAYSTQNGNGNNSGIDQGFTGSGDYGQPVATEGAPVSNDVASVDQEGGGDTSHVVQLGNNDNASVLQQNSGATSLVTQTGAFNVASVHQ